MRLPRFFKRGKSFEDFGDDVGIVVIGIAHAVTMEQDASIFARWLTSELMEDQERFLKHRENIDFAWEGFDRDPRELWEIPEVVAFVRDLNDRWPFALYFLSRAGNGLQVLQLCLATRQVPDDPGSVKLGYDREALRALLTNSWFPALNKLAHQAGLSADELERMSLSAGEYLRSGPLAG